MQGGRAAGGRFIPSASNFVGLVGRIVLWTTVSTIVRKIIHRAERKYDDSRRRSKIKKYERYMK